MLRFRYDQIPSKEFGVLFVVWWTGHGPAKNHLSQFDQAERDISRTLQIKGLLNISIDGSVSLTEDGNSTMENFAFHCL